MKPILRILKYLKYFPLQLVLNVLFSLLSILFNLGSYVMIVPFVELLFGQGELPPQEPTFAFNQQDLSAWAFWHLRTYQESVGLWRCLLIISGGYLACSLLSNLFRYMANFFLVPVRNGLIERLRNDIYYRITILPVAFFNSHRKGDIISRMSNDLADIEWSIVCTLQMLVKSPVNIIVFSATLLFVSWRLFALFLLILPIGMFLISKIGKRLKNDSQKGQNLLGNLFAVLEEAFSALRVVKAFNQQEAMQNRFAQVNDGYVRSMVKVARRRELSSPLSEVLGTLALVIMLIVGGSWVVGGHIQPSVFIFFIIIFARLIPPLLAIVQAYNNLLKGSAAASRFLEVLDADEVIREKPDAITAQPFSQSIELRDVGFHFADGKPILQHINLTIPKGSTVAIVGPSGAGKSTLVDLLPRFQDACSGTILLDGEDIMNLNINSLRVQFGLVSQDCILFNDTVAANIAFGSSSYTIEQIVEAATVANADEFIRELPQGYDTPIGDRGLNLSGGQRQRLSIARAVLRDAPILILDEATSALDAENEVAVRKGLDALVAGRTCVMIAHRLSTIRDADMIVVLDKGHIVEQGTHQQLYETDGLYRKFVNMQGLL